MRPDRSAITGVVLCGGAGRRLDGADKPLLASGGRAMLDEVLERLAPQVSTILISANRHLEDYTRRGWPVLRDATPDRGPLEGVLAAARAATTEWLLVCPGDAPRLPRTLGADLAVAVGHADAACARDGERAHPLHLLVRTARARTLHAWLDAGGRSALAWLNEVDGVQCCMDGADDAFLNINTTTDRERWQALAAEGVRTA